MQRRVAELVPGRHSLAQHISSLWLRHAARAARADAALLRLRARLRHQGAALPAAHLAARRARRSADRRLDHPRRRDAEDGHVRLPPLRPAVLPRRHRQIRRPAHRAGGDRHRLRRAGGVGAAGHEEARRLLLGLAPRLLRARHLRAEPDLDRRLDPADGQPRPLDRRALPLRRRDLRAAPHAPARRLRRPGQDDAGLRHLLHHRHALVGRPAGPQRLHRRVPDPAGTFQTHRRAGRSSPRPA